MEMPAMPQPQKRGRRSKYGTPEPKDPPVRKPRVFKGTLDDGGQHVRLYKRQGVNPITTEPNYSADETEFMMAMHTYIARSGRKFPTWSEVLEVLCSLGYEKPEATE